MLLAIWRRHRHVCENYSPMREAQNCTGDRFHQWGALSGIISLVEAGHLRLPRVLVDDALREADRMQKPSGAALPKLPKQMQSAQTIGARGLAPGRPPDVSGRAGYAQAAEAEREERSAFEGLLGSIKRYLLGALGSFGIAELGLDLPFDSEL